MTEEVSSTAAVAAPSRLRIVLIVIIVLLLAGMGALVFVFLRMLQPPGQPQAQQSGGMQWVRSIYGFGPASDEQLLEPTSVAFAPNGDVYATDPQRSRIMRFSPSGAFRSLVHTGRGGIGQGQFVRPEAIDTDKAGELFVADPVANKVIVFDDRGKFVREWAVKRPTGITVRDDTVYAISNGTVEVFSRDGKSRGSIGRQGRGAGQLEAYQGVTGDDAHVFVADALNQRVQAFDRKGEVVWVAPATAAAGVRAVVATSGTNPNMDEARSKSAFDLPQDVVLDGAGRLVVVDAFKFQLVVLSPKTGDVLATYGEEGPKDGDLFYPSGIDYDAARDWFAVADTRNNRIQILRLPGSGGSGAASARRLLTSPYRYIAVPLALGLLALVVGLASMLRPRRRRLLPQGQ